MYSCLIRTFVLLLMAGSFLLVAGYAQTAELASPRVVRAVAPQVSALTKILRQRGLVSVKVLIDTDGKVIEASALEGPNFARLDAIEAAKQWTFAPANQTDGIRNVTLRFLFRLAPRDVSASGVSPETSSPYEIRVWYTLPPRFPEEVTPANYEHKDEQVEERCKVHRVYLRKDIVPIKYGLLLYSPGYERAYSRLFPNANTWVGGGCVVDTQVIEYDGGSEEIGPPKYAEVEYCELCRQALTRWHRNHPQKKKDTTR